MKENAELSLDQIAKQAQKCFQSNPTLILGSGASMPHGLPSMGALKNYLLDNVEPEEGDETDQWLLVRSALHQGDHLEAALEGKNLPNSLLDKIVVATWACVNEKDHAAFLEIASNLTALPLGQILKGLFQSSNNEINIVTTNYDRLIEYACNSVNVIFHAGFNPGYFQTWSAEPKLNFKRGQQSERVVRLWKVHGSLDWFNQEDGQTIGMPVFSMPDKSLIPQIVTPGLNKYQKTLEDPFRSTMAGADRSLKAAEGFLCVGYGFRDEHIHPKINQRCREANVPIVILARTLTDEAKKFMSEKAGENYLGIEQSDDISKVYTAKTPDGVLINEPGLWSLSGFQKHLI